MTSWLRRPLTEMDEIQQDQQQQQVSAGPSASQPTSGSHGSGNGSGDVSGSGWDFPWDPVTLKAVLEKVAVGEDDHDDSSSNNPQHDLRKRYSRKDVLQTSTIDGDLLQAVLGSGDCTAPDEPATKAKRVKKPLICQIPGCGSSLADARKYFQRYRVCEAHLKASRLTINHLTIRFCDQCSKFHQLDEFKGNKRTCEAKLAITRMLRANKKRTNEMADDNSLDRTQSGGYNNWDVDTRILLDGVQVKQSGSNSDSMPGPNSGSHLTMAAAYLQQAKAAQASATSAPSSAGYDYHNQARLSPLQPQLSLPSQAQQSLPPERLASAPQQSLQRGLSLGPLPMRGTGEGRLLSPLLDGRTHTHAALGVRLPDNANSLDLELNDLLYAMDDPQSDDLAPGRTMFAAAGAAAGGAGTGTTPGGPRGDGHSVALPQGGLGGRFFEPGLSLDMLHLQALQGEAGLVAGTATNGGHNTHTRNPPSHAPPIGMPPSGLHMALDDMSDAPYPLLARMPETRRPLQYRGYGAMGREQAGGHARQGDAYVQYGGLGPRAAMQDQEPMDISSGFDHAGMGHMEIGMGAQMGLHGRGRGLGSGHGQLHQHLSQAVDYLHAPAINIPSTDAGMDAMRATMLDEQLMLNTRRRRHASINPGHALADELMDFGMGLDDGLSLPSVAQRDAQRMEAAHAMLMNHGLYQQTDYASRGPHGRVNMKIGNATPADLPPDLQAAMAAYLGQASGVSGMTNIRPGCVQMLVNVMQQPGLSLPGASGTAAAADTAAVPALGACLLQDRSVEEVQADLEEVLGLRLCEKLTVQVDDVVFVRSAEAGTYLGHYSAAPEAVRAALGLPLAAAAEASTPVSLPQILECSTRVVVANRQSTTPLQLQVQGQHLSSPAVRISARRGGVVVPVVQLPHTPSSTGGSSSSSSSEACSPSSSRSFNRAPSGHLQPSDTSSDVGDGSVTIQLPAQHSPGFLLLEPCCGSLMGRDCPVVVVPDAEVAAELQSMLAAEADPSKLSDLLHDLGSVLDCWYPFFSLQTHSWGSKEDASNEKLISPGHLNLGAAHPNLSDTIRSRALDVLAFCVSRGLMHTARMVVGMAEVNGLHLEEVMQEAKLGGSSLFVCTLKSRSVAMLQQVLTWSRQCGHNWDVTAPCVHGMNCLQAVASLPREVGEPLAIVLLQAIPSAPLHWFTAANRAHPITPNELAAVNNFTSAARVAQRLVRPIAPGMQAIHSMLSTAGTAAGRVGAAMEANGGLAAAAPDGSTAGSVCAPSSFVATSVGSTHTFGAVSDMGTCTTSLLLAAGPEHPLVVKVAAAGALDGAAGDEMFFDAVESTPAAADELPADPSAGADAGLPAPVPPTGDGASPSNAATAPAAEACAAKAGADAAEQSPAAGDSGSSSSSMAVPWSALAVLGAVLALLWGPSAAVFPAAVTSLAGFGALFLVLIFFITSVIYYLLYGGSASARR